MRNNLERLGQPGPKTDDNAEPILTNNSNISYVDPTEVVLLPTKGKYYPKDHHLHGKEFVEIGYMKTKELEILNSRTLVQKNVALDKVLGNLLVDKKINVSDLFVGDKNALILAVRKTGFTSEYRTKISCPQCEQKTEVFFDLNKVQPKEPPKDVKIDQNGHFDVVLPYSKRNVSCRLLTAKDDKDMKVEEEKQKKLGLPESPVSNLLKKIIVAVDGNDDGEVVFSFIDQMMAMDIVHLQREYERIVPNMNLEQVVECKMCYSESEVSLPFTADFFWPRK